MASNALPSLYLSPDPYFPLPDKDIVSPQLVTAFAAVLKTHFPTVINRNLYDCAIVAAFLQSTTVFDNLFRVKGDSLLFCGYLDTLIDCLERDLPISNILMRTFCRLMSRYGFNRDYHTVTFTGDAGGSFSAVVKNKILFKDMIGWQHGQYTHALQWLGVCLLYDTPDLCPGYRFNMSPGELYAYMVTRRTAVGFPGELVDGQAKEFSSKTIWDFCVDCFRDVAGHENPVLNLYTSSYRSPANITNALLAGGTLCNTWMGQFMQRRAHKYAQQDRRYQGSNNFQKLAQKLQVKKKRLLFRADKGGEWITTPGQGTVVRVWTDPHDQQLRDALIGPMVEYHQRTANRPAPQHPAPQELYNLHQSQDLNFAMNWLSLVADEMEKLIQEATGQDLKS